MYFVSRNYSVFPENSLKTTAVSTANVINDAVLPLTTFGRWLGIFPISKPNTADTNRVLGAIFDHFRSLLMISILLLEIVINLVLTDFKQFVKGAIIFNSITTIAYFIGRLVAMAVVVISCMKSRQFLPFLAKLESINPLLQPHEKQINKFARLAFLLMLLLVFMFWALISYMHSDSATDRANPLAVFWFSLRFCTAFLEFSVISIYPFFCVILCKALAHAFENVNSKLQLLTTPGPDFCTSDHQTVLRELRERHGMLSEMVEETGKLFSPSLTLVILSQTMSLCLGLKWVVVATDFGALRGIYLQLWMLAVFGLRLTLLGVMCLTADGMTKKASGGLKFIYSDSCSKLNAESRFQLYLLKAMMTNCPVILTASGFVKLNTQLLVQILGVAITYCVVIVQNS